MYQDFFSALYYYRAEKKSWYVVARNFFLLLLNFSAWPCLGAAYQDLQRLFLSSGLLQLQKDIESDLKEF